jgi:hypothetical protein
LDIWGRRWHQLFRVSPRITLFSAFTNEIASIPPYHQLHPLPLRPRPKYNPHHCPSIHPLSSVPLSWRTFDVSRPRHWSPKRIFHPLGRRLWAGIDVQEIDWTSSPRLAG